MARKAPHQVFTKLVAPFPCTIIAEACLFKGRMAQELRMGKALE